jgi:hypothetical protein
MFFSKFLNSLIKLISNKYTIFGFNAISIGWLNWLLSDAFDPIDFSLRSLLSNIWNIFLRKLTILANITNAGIACSGIFVAGFTAAGIAKRNIIEL